MYVHHVMRQHIIIAVNLLCYSCCVRESKTYTNEFTIPPTFITYA